MEISRIPESVEPASNTSTSEGATQVSTPLRGECLLGELTDRGRASTLRMGQHLRSIYVDELNLLPAQLQREDEGKGWLYVRSTNMPRTTESAMQVCKGLLESEAGSSYRPTIFVRNGHQESLLPNTYSCPTLQRLDAHFSRQAARLLNPWLATLDPVLSPHLSQDGATKLRVDGHPRLSGVLDSLRCAKAHSMGVPEVLRENGELVDGLEGAVCREWFGGYAAGRGEREKDSDEGDVERSKVFRRLAMGPLLRDLQGHLDAQAADASTKPPLRMGIYATHDTTLAGMLATLDVYGGRRWPAFTASVGVELWKEPTKQAATTPKQPQHYVRLLYDGRPVRMPWCAPGGQASVEEGPELCPLELFKAKVEREVNEGRPKDPQTGKAMSWDQECLLGRGERSSK